MRWQYLINKEVKINTLDVTHIVKNVDRVGDMLFLVTGDGIYVNTRHIVWFQIVTNEMKHQEELSKKADDEKGLTREDVLGMMKDVMQEGRGGESSGVSEEPVGEDKGGQAEEGSGTASLRRSLSPG